MGILTSHDMLTVGSLFSGIGGLELGLERAGMRVVWQVEADEYARHVLAKHWPNVARYTDVRTVGAATLAPVDLICGGFPCQDISTAGKGAGITGARSGLWTEFARIIRELRPRYVLVENVPALLSRGMGRVLGDLAASGYDAEWDCIPAAAVGAPHRRDRIFIVATDADRTGRCEQRRSVAVRPQFAAPERYGWWESEPGVGGGADGVPAELDGGIASVAAWERGIPRVATGVANRVARLRCLGNSVVPQVAEHIGRMIIAAESGFSAHVLSDCGEAGHATNA